MAAKHAPRSHVTQRGQQLHDVIGEVVFFWHGLANCSGYQRPSRCQMVVVSPAWFMV